MQSVTLRKAALKALMSNGPKALCGQSLNEVKTLQASILAHGLLSPLIVKTSGKQLIVVDGHKRLLALRRLKAIGKLPRDLNRLPYVLIGEHVEMIETPMSLLTQRDQLMEISRLKAQGFSLREIASALYVSKQHIHDVLTVFKLSRTLQSAYLCGSLSLQQARAFATLPNREAQDALIQALGPFAKEPDIIRAIYSGETVLPIKDGNVIILPSRKPSLYMETAA